MRHVSVVRRGFGLLLAGIAVGVVLTGCTPGSPTATRLNSDGTVSFVSCISVEDIDFVEKETWVRSGFPARIDDSKTVEMEALDQIDDVEARAVYTFRPGTAEWDQAYISLGHRGGDFVGGGIDRDAAVDAWEWNTSARCEIEE